MRWSVRLPPRNGCAGVAPTHVLFKICSTFDSTDKGNIGPVTDALRAASGDAIVLVTPAFPETGRTVYKGNLFVGAVPLNESPLKDHPLNPMHDSNLVRVLARQSKTKIGLVELATLSRGADAVRARLADLAKAGHRRRHHRRGVRSRSRNHRQGRGQAPPLGRRLRYRTRSGAGAGRRNRAECSGCSHRKSRSAVPRRVSPAAARRPRSARSPAPRRSCRCCISIPIGSSRARTRPVGRWPGRANVSAAIRS